MDRRVLSRARAGLVAGAALSAAALGLATACYDPAFRDCQLRCGDGGACPEGLTCDGDGLCRTGDASGRCDGAGGAGGAAGAGGAGGAAGGGGSGGSAGAGGSSGAGGAGASGGAGGSGGSGGSAGGGAGGAAGTGGSGGSGGSGGGAGGSACDPPAGTGGVCGSVAYLPDTLGDPAHPGWQETPPGGGASLSTGPQGLVVQFPAAPTALAFAELVSARTFDTNGGSIAVEVDGVGSTGLGTLTYLDLRVGEGGRGDAGSYFGHRDDGGTGRIVVGGMALGIRLDSGAVDLPYDPATQRWWRLRHEPGPPGEDGAAIFEVGPDLDSLVEVVRTAVPPPGASYLTAALGAEAPRTAAGAVGPRIERVVGAALAPGAEVCPLAFADEFAAAADPTPFNHKSVQAWCSSADIASGELQLTVNGACEAVRGTSQPYDLRGHQLTAQVLEASPDPTTQARAGLRLVDDAGGTAELSVSGRELQARIGGSTQRRPYDQPAHELWRVRAEGCELVFEYGPATGVTSELARMPAQLRLDAVRVEFFATNPGGRSLKLRVGRVEGEPAP